MQTSSTHQLLPCLKFLNTLLLLRFPNTPRFLLPRLHICQVSTILLFCLLLLHPLNYLRMEFLQISSQCSICLLHPITITLLPQLAKWTTSKLDWPN